MGFDEIEVPDQKRFFDFRDAVKGQVDAAQQRTGSVDKAAAKVTQRLFEKTKGDESQVTPEMVGQTFDEIAEEHRQLNEGQ